MTYDPHNWFWIIAGDETRAWSSAARGYVDIAQADPDRDGSAVRMTYDPHNWFWIVAGDEGRAFSSAVGSYVDISEADPERTTLIDSEESMITVLREANVPPYHQVAKSTVLSRLGDDGAAKAFALTTVGQQLRWNAPDKPAVNADDAETIAIIRSIGRDPDVILAPE